MPKYPRLPRSVYVETAEGWDCETVGTMKRSWHINTCIEWRLWNSWDHEAVSEYMYKDMHRTETMKQSGPWSSRGSHGVYVFTLVLVMTLGIGSYGYHVFTLVMKPGIVKFWLLKFNFPLMVKMNPLPPPPPPQNKKKKDRGLNQGVLHPTQIWWS